MGLDEQRVQGQPTRACCGVAWNLFRGQRLRVGSECSVSCFEHVQGHAEDITSTLADLGHTTQHGFCSLHGYSQGCRELLWRPLPRARGTSRCASLSSKLGVVWWSLSSLFREFGVVNLGHYLIPANLLNASACACVSKGWTEPSGAVTEILPAPPALDGDAVGAPLRMVFTLAILRSRSVLESPGFGNSSRTESTSC